jgi:hypothetical protein
MARMSGLFILIAQPVKFFKFFVLCGAAQLAAFFQRRFTQLVEIVG